MLAVVDSPVSGTEVHENGLIVVRLADYPGAARGTLAVVADGDSPAGDVLKDTQNLTAATTFSNRYSSVSNTAVVPVADFGLVGNAYSYGVWLSLRVAGRPPVNARVAEEWNSQKTQVGPSVAMLIDGSVDTTHVRIPRANYSHYTMANIGFFTFSDLGSATNIQLRAWGVGTMEMYLDLLYLVPQSLKATDTGDIYFAGDYPAMGLFSGSPSPDQDHSANLTVGGVHSVMPFANSAIVDDSVWDNNAGWDYQADDDEPSEINLANGNFFENETTASYMIAVGCGTRLVNFHTVEDENFAGGGLSATQQVLKTSQGYMVTTFGGNFPGTQYGFFNPGVPDHITGLYVEAGHLRAYCSEGPPFIGGDIPLGFRAYVQWTLGMHPQDLFNGFVSTDPRTYCPVLHGIESFVMLSSFTPELTPAGADVQFLFGGMSWTNDTSIIPEGACGAVFTHDDTDSITLQLMKFWANISDGDSGLYLQNFGDSPVSVSGGTGDIIWVRVEKRWIHWRARTWLDGDDEPDTWDVEGFEPFSIRNSISSHQLVHYPYDDNWVTTGSNTIYSDPRNQLAGGGASAHTGYVPGGIIQLGNGFSVNDYNAKILDVKVDYDPDYPDGSGAFVDSNYRLENSLTAESWGQVTTDAGALRVLETDYASHHFNFDTDGGTLYAWLDSGAHPLSAAAFGPIYARHYIRRQPQIYRRVFG